MVYTRTFIRFQTFYLFSKTFLWKICFFQSFFFSKNLFFKKNLLSFPQNFFFLKISFIKFLLNKSVFSINQSILFIFFRKSENFVKKKFPLSFMHKKHSLKFRHEKNIVFKKYFFFYKSIGYLFQKVYSFSKFFETWRTKIQ